MTRPVAIRPVDGADPHPEGLTGIPPRIHWPATQDTDAEGTSELDRIAVEAFLEALAEIAVNVARRQGRVAE